jgi:hypothetical protein
LLLQNFLPKYFGIPVCLIEVTGTEILRYPELFHIKSRVPKYFGIPVVLIDITGTINRGLSGLGARPAEPPGLTEIVFSLNQHNPRHPRLNKLPERNEG